MMAAADLPRRPTGREADRISEAPCSWPTDSQYGVAVCPGGGPRAAGGGRGLPDPTLGCLQSGDLPASQHLASGEIASSRDSAGDAIRLRVGHGAAALALMPDDGLDRRRVASWLGRDILDRQPAPYRNRCGW